VSAKAPEVLVLSTSLLVWGLLFGSVGLGFFVYGRKQKVVVPLICGLVLMVFPYFISNTILLVAIGVTLIVLPYFVRI
jgi:predicted membrane protein